MPSKANENLSPLGGTPRLVDKGSRKTLKLNKLLGKPETLSISNDKSFQAFHWILRGLSGLRAITRAVVIRAIILGI